MNRRTLLGSATLLGTIWSPHRLVAQADTAALPPIVITATRVPTPRAATTASVTVLTGSQLRAQGLVYLRDALREVAGLTVVQSGSPGGVTSVFVRGGESDYVKVLVDGVPVNEPGGTYDFADLTLDDVARVEIVRGPASVLYGSDAMSGVIQVFTRDGVGAARVEAGADGGTYGTTDMHALVRGGTGTLDYALSGSRQRTDGLYAFNSQFRTGTLGGRVRITPDARTRATLSVHYTNGEYHYPTDGAGNVVDHNAYQTNVTTTVGLDLARVLSHRLETHLFLASNAATADVHDAPDGPADTVGFFGYQSWNALTRRSADARLVWRPAAGAAVSVGASVEREAERDTALSLSSYGDSRSADTWSRLNGGMYAEAQAVAGGFAANLGARLDDNQRFGTFGTYRVGVAYRFSSGTRLSGNVGTAFKEPTFLENFGGGGFVIGNPDLKPERAFSLDAGVEQAIAGGRIVVSGTYFHQAFRDLIQYTATPPAAEQSNYFNIAGANADGVEAELTLHPTSTVRVSGGYTYLSTAVTNAGFDSGPDATFVTGERLLRRPTHQTEVTAAWQALDRLEVTGRFDYVGDRVDRDFAVFPATRVTLPAYTTLGASADFRLTDARGTVPGLTLTARIDNLFDAAYQEAIHYPALGRRIWLGGRVAY